jgi:glycosyltransferase involved in cell wall biosynthesis
VPLSADHFQAADRLSQAAGGRTVIDVSFPMLAHLSADFIRHVEELVPKADILVFSHPWVYPLTAHLLDRPRQLLVYDAHNFEGFLRAELLDDGAVGTEIAKHVVATEFGLAQKAGLVAVCSKEDGALFGDMYGVPETRIHIVPNGVFSRKLTPPTPAERASARDAFSLHGQSALFLGSGYGPNLQAARFVVEHLAPELPDTCFLLCGGVADSAEIDQLRTSAPPNVRFVGTLSEENKQRWLHAADVAINPMFSGSGTNIKMFDFLAAGLPTLATPVGARGIDPGNPPSFLVAEPERFVAVLADLLADQSLTAVMAKRGRALVEARFSWEKLSPALGTLFLQAFADLGTGGVSLDSTPAPPQQVCQELKVAQLPTVHLSTWGTRCGIAEYAANIAESLETMGAESLIASVRQDGRITMTRGRHLAEPMTVEDMAVWGNVAPVATATACLKAGAKAVLLHYHPAFFPPLMLTRLTRTLCDAGLRVAAVLHNSRDLTDGELTELAATGATLLVHNDPELVRLRELGGLRVLRVPMGLPELPDEPTEAARARLELGGGPIIGSFGFLRPHKGVSELIEAMAIVREVHPGAVLLGLHALYPSSDSEACLAECMDKVKALHLEGAVRLETRFRKISEVVQDLHACDVVVMPYHQSSEGASASAHTAIAARRPVLFTRQEIFGPLARLGYTVESSAPVVLAAGLLAFLASPHLLKQSARRVGEFVQEHGWRTVGACYAAVLYGDSGEREEPS